MISANTSIANKSKSKSILVKEELFYTLTSYIKMEK